MKLYWVSAIIFNDGDRKPWLCVMSNGQLSLKAAKKVIENARNNHNVLAAWVDVFEGKNKQTVFHECYINALGNIDR